MLANDNADPLFDKDTFPFIMPETIEETGLSYEYIADLVLKAVSSDANCTSERIAAKIKLPIGIAETLLQHLYREKLVEIREGLSYGNHRYAILNRGWERVQHLLSVSGYIGPAPVSLDAYTAAVRWMAAQRTPATPRAVAAAYAGLVLSEHALQVLGLVVDSRRSLFLTGPAGSGKTAAAMALEGALTGEIWIPYAIEVDGQVIRVFDFHTHQLLPPPTQPHDLRWIRVKPPLIVVGGEMTIESMDLIYSSNIRMYEAPFQMKCNGGVLIIDDFGRQRINPHDLLNRWIIPLETRVDYLTLHTGKKIEVPFEQLLVFATNLEPKELVDEAFLRRMGYRLAFTKPSVATYELILKRYLNEQGLDYEPVLLEDLLSRYKAENREMKACEPRDLVERCLDICRYENQPRKLTRQLMERAWRNYFGTCQGDFQERAELTVANNWAN